uniref:Uncharacterized protein n=1 Tax=Oryza punctata TaxID=4537 RepID=A0A0E0JZA4_ORYPU
MQTDIAGELVREAKTLWEKLKDGIAGTNQEVMAAVDSLRRKVRSTSVREAPTIPTIPEITQMSERLGGFGPIQDGTRMIRPVPQMPHPRPHMIPQMTPDVPTSHWQGGFAPFAGPTQSVPLHAPTYGTNPWQGQSIDYGGTSFGAGVQGYMDLLQQGDWLFGQYPSHRNEIPYMQAPSTGSFRPELIAGFRPYASSYGDMSSFSGGSSQYPMSFGLRKLMMRRR